MRFNDEDKAICDFATQGTSWYWTNNPKCKAIGLRSTEGGGDIVMDFVRWGMFNASPRFNSKLVISKKFGVDSFSIMERAEKYFEVIPGREHHKDWEVSLNHPDAVFISHFNPYKVRGLLDEIEKLQKRVKELEEKK